ncbi:hypothetical protein J2129_000835 [Methanofollis sp. W23]|uniref:hypothetical protein n=1 Tax=Methanofollis sp. W23 TaxID=2817849 RepID=UPI001AE85819|nr:hypothetical protein [Methanofollis sp. W23]MBP2145381.1 hypothetical protein [Methanofollis sp. W23]
MHKFGTKHIAKEFVLGFTLGSYAAENHNNPYYDLGSVLSGVAVFGDIRDASVAISRGEKQEAIICIVGVCPVGATVTRPYFGLSLLPETFPNIPPSPKRIRAWFIATKLHNFPVRVRVTDISLHSHTRVDAHGRGPA